MFLNESLLLLGYQLRIFSSLWQAAKTNQLIMLKKILVPNSWYTEIRHSPENSLTQHPGPNSPPRNTKQQPAHTWSQPNLQQKTDEKPLKPNIFSNPANALETLPNDLLFCDLITILARCQKHLPGPRRYSAPKSSQSTLRQKSN